MIQRFKQIKRIFTDYFKRDILFFTFIVISGSAFCQQPATEISGSIDWQTMQLNAEISLDLQSARLRLPSGRIQAEIILNDNYLNLINSPLIGLQVDSSSSISDLVTKRELSPKEIETLALKANSIAPALSADMRKITASHTLSLSNVITALLRHTRPSPIIRTLNPITTARYTGIIIIATDSLPVYSMKSSARAIPCLFPKIWDTEMNLIYERNMLEINNTSMVRYTSSQNIFQNTPSGLTPELQAIVGDRPLRIFAAGVFGVKPTDLIIDRNDALLIISSEENKRLLSQGRVVFVLDDSVLRSEF
ncbi:MAG: polymerase [Treponema sp.]|nr:polymerase [Treponema sp.]MCL2252112.1 polymerase [Treponema sp.]